MATGHALVAGGIGLLLGLAVLAPLLGPGVVLLLDYGDYPVGPNPRLPGSVWGFTPGLTSRGPVNAAVVAAFQAMPWGAFRLAPLLAAPVLIAVGFGLLFRGSRLRSTGAALLYFVNPWVYERMLAGQVYLVLGYALLPLLLALLVRSRRSPVAAVVGGMLLAVAISLSPHYFFIGGLVLLGCLASAVLRHDGRGIVGLLVASFAAVVCSVYWLLPARQLAPRLQELAPAQLASFRAMPDPHLGLLPNLAGLYGFWRQGWPLPKDSLPGWPLFLAAMLVVIGSGFAVALRSNGSRPVALLLLVLGGLGLCLAAGDAGPTGAAFSWAFERFAAFRIMREPQKFIALLALAYAWGFGMGIDAIAARAHGTAGRVLVVALLLVVPGVYTFRMFWGFNGYVKPSLYPASWAEADRIMGSGRERVLALPWHQYVPFAWTQGRVVANPMASYFSRDTIVGDDVELASVESQARTARSWYLEFLLEAGPETHSFGNLVGPLDVRFVLVSKTLDWRRYDWLWRQSDLRLVGEWSDLALFENLTPTARAYAPATALEVEDWGELVGAAAKVRLLDYAIQVERAGPGRVRAPDGRITRGSSRRLAPSAASPVRYDFGSLGAGTDVVLSEPFDASWMGSGGSAVDNMGVTTLVSVGATGDGVLRYGRWPVVRTGYVTSAAGAVLLLTAVLALGLLRRNRVRRSVNQIGS